MATVTSSSAPLLTSPPRKNPGRQPPSAKLDAPIAPRCGRVKRYGMLDPNLNM